MKQLKLKSVRAEGFRSYVKPVVFNFDTTGLFSITGENGEGKSTLFAALMWALYGVNINGGAMANIQTYPHKRPADYAGTRATVTIRRGKKEYLVARHMNYKKKTLGVLGESRLMVFAKPIEEPKFLPEHMVGDELYKKDQQAYINRLVGVSSNAFLNSIMFGQRMARLISASGSDKRELFEEFCDTGFVDDAQTSAKAKQQELNNLLVQRRQEAAVFNAKIETAEQNLANYSGILARFDADKEERLASIKAEHAKLKDLRSKLELELEQKEAALAAKSKGVSPDKVRQLMNEADKLNAAKDAVADDLRTYSRHVKDVDLAIRKAEDEEVKLAAELRDMQDTCSTCGQPLDAKAIKKSKANYETKMEDCRKQVLALRNQRGVYARKEEELKEKYTTAEQEFSKAYDAYSEAKSSMTKEDDSVGMLRGRIEALTKSMADCKTRHAEEKERKAPGVDIKGLTASIAEMKEQLEVTSNKIIKIEKRLAHVEWWVSEGFSSKGLRSYIFSAMLQQFNDYAARYGAYLGYTIKFYIDLSKQSKPFVTTVSDGSIEVPYENLSGGQKQRVDICMAFAMHDLVCDRIDTNILILDEIFEGLSVSGVELVRSIIEEKAKTKAVYLVTHNPMFAADTSRTYVISGGNASGSTIE